MNKEQQELVKDLFHACQTEEEEDFLHRLCVSSGHFWDCRCGATNDGEAPYCENCSGKRALSIITPGPND